MYILPPEQYLQEYPEPMRHGPTNRDLLNWAIDLKMVNELHASDKQALIEWADEVAR